ncbi:DUF2905 family protein [Neobacillus sp. D3-1R]
MTGLAKFIMIIGAIIFLVGFIMQFVNLGKLPGDIYLAP